MKIKQMQERNQSQESDSHANQHFEESTLSALDAVCRSDSQTYDQFMANFTQLTPADVNKPAANQSRQVGVAEDDWQPPDLPPLGRKPQAKPKGLVQADSFTAANVVAPPPSESITSEPRKVAAGEGLEEEVLQKGTVPETYLVRATGNTRTPKVKLSNFVEDDDLSEDDDLNAYLPSFSYSGSSNAEAQSTNRVPTLPSKPVAISKPAKPASVANENAPMDMLAELAAIKSGNASSVPKATIQNNDLVTNHDLYTNDPQTNDLELPERDGCEVAAQIMAHASVTTNENEAEENILDLIGQDDDQSESEDDDNVYNPALDLPNPGEVVEEKDSIVKDFMTKLNFTAHVRDGMENVSYQVRDRSETAAETQQANIDETSTECVQPFSLDADFDYDNVILSPKYNEAEMAIIMQSMKPTAQEQANASS